MPRRRRAQVESGGPAAALEARLRRMLVAALALAAAGCSRDPGWHHAAEFTAPSYDHHVHILSPQLIEDWRSLGVEFSRPDAAYTSAVAALAEGGATHAFLVSMAHIYGSTEFRQALKLTDEEEHTRVRLANNQVAYEAAQQPQHYVGFCSVHPLRPYARAELRRCLEEGKLRGIKLHLPGGDVDPVNPDHLAILSSIAAEAAAGGRPLLLHVAEFGDRLSPDVAAGLLARLLEPNPGLELYLAHVGGGGGYRGSSRVVLQALRRRLTERPAAHRVHVELSGTVLASPTDGVPASTRADLRQLAEDLRAIGLERVLFGSDYPVFSPGEYARLLQSRLPLDPGELARLMQNRAPAFGPVN